MGDKGGKASYVEARSLSGFQDLMPSEALAKTRMLATLRSVFESFGYAPIETPHIEYSDILINETEGEIGKQLYRFEDNGGRDVCLRFDLTVPFARYVVQYANEIGSPFKRYAVGSVFRGERPQFGRYREFTQCDFDFVGTDSLCSDAETLQVTCACMEALNVGDFVIRVNHRKVMNGLAAIVGVEERAAEFLRIIDKLDKIGRDKVAEQLGGDLGVDSDDIEKVLDFVGTSFSCDEVNFDHLNEFRSQSEVFSEGLDDLEEMAQLLDSVPITKGRCQIDFSIARGLGYYTGVVYETRLVSVPEVGSVCGGGRYDNLTMNFSPNRSPGVGASIGLSRLIAAQEKLGLLEKSDTPADVLFVQMEKENSGYIYQAAGELRSLGVKAEVYPECSKLKKQFQYADRKGYKFVIVIGADEMAQGTLTLKNMETGEQESVGSVSELAGVVTYEKNEER